MPASDLRIEARAATMLARLLVAELARWSLEHADVRDRIRGRRSSGRKRALKGGAVALGVVSGVLVARRLRSAPPPVETPKEPEPAA
jgi:hypothetical protein